MSLINLSSSLTRSLLGKFRPCFSQSLIAQGPEVVRMRSVHPQAVELNIAANSESPDTDNRNSY